MRRRYGIPDTDQRPFNVAFAAVAQDRDNRGSKSAAPLQRLPAEDQEPEPTRGNDAKLRQRRVPSELVYICTVVAGADSVYRRYHVQQRTFRPRLGASSSLFLFRNTLHLRPIRPSLLRTTALTHSTTATHPTRPFLPGGSKQHPTRRVSPEAPTVERRQRHAHRTQPWIQTHRFCRRG
jgi:hypothetical protein